MIGAVRAACILGLLADPAVARPRDDPASARAAAVERGLAPAVALAGRPVPRRTIAAEMYRLHVPGVSVAVLRGGIVDWSRGYGATRAGGAPVTPDTLFQAGSISKPVTALAALRLVQQHRLSLDGDVNDRLKAWKLPVPAGTRVILRELLNHTAGTTVHGFPGYAAGAPVPTIDDVLAGRPPANTKAVVVDTAPGTAWRYSAVRRCPAQRGAAPGGHGAQQFRPAPGRHRAGRRRPAARRRRRAGAGRPAHLPGARRREPAAGSRSTARALGRSPAAIESEPSSPPWLTTSGSRPPRQTPRSPCSASFQSGWSG